MNEVETKVAEAKTEARIEAYLDHVGDYNDGFKAGVLTLLDMCQKRPDMHNVLLLELCTIHQNPKISSLYREFSQPKAEPPPQKISLINPR